MLTAVGSWCKFSEVGLKTDHGESMQSVLKKNGKATVGRICRKVRFKPGMKD